MFNDKKEIQNPLGERNIIARNTSLVGDINSDGHGDVAIDTGSEIHVRSGATGAVLWTTPFDVNWL